MPPRPRGRAPSRVGPGRPAGPRPRSIGDHRRGCVAAVGHPVRTRRPRRLSAITRTTRCSGCYPATPGCADSPPRGAAVLRDLRGAGSGCMCDVDVRLRCRTVSRDDDLPRFSQASHLSSGDHPPVPATCALGVEQTPSPLALRQPLWYRSPIGIHYLGGNDAPGGQVSRSVLGSTPWRAASARFCFP